MPEFVLRTHDIPDAGRQETFGIEPSWLVAVLEGTDVRAPAAAKPGRLDVSAQRSGGEYLVTAHIETAVATDCVRCLGEALVPVRTDVTALYVPRPAGVSDEELEARENRALEEDPAALDTSREYFDGDRLVLDGLVREHILLEVPMQPRCAESCPGIEIPAHVRPPADFGKAEEVDPRLAPLKKLAERFSKT